MTEPRENPTPEGMPAEGATEGSIPAVSQPEPPVVRPAQPAYGQYAVGFPPATDPVATPVAGQSTADAAANGTPPTAPHAPAPARNRLMIPVVAALAVGALVGGAAGAGVTLLAGGIPSAQVPVLGDRTPGTITVNNDASATTVTAVAAKAGPSVVTISVADRNGNGTGTGSGVVIDDKGHIVTNTHVVTLDGASSSATISVRTWDGRILDATLVGTDPLSDLAVIKVDAADLPPISIGDSNRLNVGDVTVAIGAPLGLANTVTDGIVSALNRSISVASSAAPDQGGDAPQAPGDSPFDFWRFDNGQGGSSSRATSTVQLSVLQTDASINPGNSGGALLNARGELVGINVAIASAGNSNGASAGSIGVGFAIPSNLVERVAAELIASGKATHGLLGAMVKNSTSGQLGAAVENLTSNGPAASAGVRKGDVITYLGDTPITSASDLTAQVRALAAGSETTVTVVRGSQVTTLKVTLGALE